MNIVWWLLPRLTKTTCQFCAWVTYRKSFLSLSLLLPLLFLHKCPISLSLSLSLSLRRAEKYIHGMDKTVNWWETNSSFSTQNCSLSFPCSMLVYLIIVSSLLFTSIFLSLCPASFMAQRLHCISMFLSITLPISICPLLFFLFKILFIMSLQRCCSITLSWK